VTLPSAVNVIAGQEVRVAGLKVGSIADVKSADHGRAARIAIDIDDAHWPMSAQSRFALYWGGTVAFSNRYVALTPGPATAARLGEGATIPPSRFTVPVEFDDVLRTFTPQVRSGVKSLIDNGGRSLRNAAPALRDALRTAPPALTNTSQVLADLTANERALGSLVDTATDVTAAVDRADPGLRGLIADTATTLDATAREAKGVQGTLDAAPRTMIAARTTLGHADRTLKAAGRMAVRLNPGLDQVRAIATPLNSLLRRVTDIGPDARTTLATARRATSDLNPLLSELTGRMPELRSILSQANDQLKCIRPYTPDITAFASTWADFLSYRDGKDGYFRAQIQEILPLPHNVYTGNSGDLVKAFPQVRFAYPRPPGANANQPWFLPECGITPSALDPSSDPEAKPYDIGQQLSPTPARKAGR
jgi:phospholipid/cholesterol/gamma-HCH transport system substrate-binding protein